MGNYFSYMIQKNPKKNYIGIELRYKRLYITAKKADQAQKESNIIKSPLAPSAVKRNLGFRVCNKNRYIMLRSYGQSINEIFTHQEISETYIYFPDPFSHKPKQIKHRLLNHEFLKNIFYCTQIN